METEQNAESVAPKSTETNEPEHKTHVWLAREGERLENGEFARFSGWAYTCTCGQDSFGHTSKDAAEAWAEGHKLDGDVQHNDGCGPACADLHTFEPPCTKSHFEAQHNDGNSDA